MTVGLAVVALWLLLDLPTPGSGFVTAAIVAPLHISIVLATFVTALREDI